MAIVTVNDSTLTDIADSIRAKLGVQDTYKPSEMPDAIDSISGGGITPTGTKEITANGTGIDVAAYAYADVAVPNSYAAGDEGKVVSNGALVAQTSDTVTTNDTYDTTLINSLTVNVSGGVTPTGTKEISITQNGTTTEDVTNYASAEITVNVPSSSFSAMTVKIKNGRTSQIAINRVMYNSTTMLSAARANVNVDATATYTDMATDGQYIFFDSSSGTTVSYNGATATFNRSSTKFRVKIPDNFDSSIPFVIS